MELEYMSFSTEVKNELCSVSMSRACCTSAEAYGALLYGNCFSSLFEDSDSTPYNAPEVNAMRRELSVLMYHVR